MAWGFFGGEQRGQGSDDSRFNYGKGRISSDAQPGLWDTSMDARANMMKGLEGIRPVFGTNDYGANAQQYGSLGLAAQQNALGMFANQASGNGPSLAQLQLQQGMGQQQRAAMAMAGQRRDGNLAGGYQQAQGAMSGGMANYNQQAAMVRAQEQLAAQQAYAGLASQMSQQGLQYDQLGMQNALGQDQNALNWYSAKRGLDMQASQNKWGRMKDAFGMSMSGVSTLGSLMTLSDVRAKEDMMPVSAADAAAQVQPLAYRYKPGMGPNGQQIGVSAQQLAGTPLGSTLVGEGPNGMLGVDGGRAGIAALAASGENARRLRMLEQQLAESSGDGSLAQRYGTREEGMANTRRAQMLSDSISAQRGAAQVARGRAEGPQAYNFTDSPQMRRGGAQAIDPFSSNTVGSNTTQGLAGLRARYFPELVR